MGRTLVAALQDNAALTLAAAIERPGMDTIGADAGEIAGIGKTGIPVSDDLVAVCSDFDVLIDFTLADATARNVQVCASRGKKMVIGTTGLSDAQKEQVHKAGERVAIVIAPNFSIGVNATFRLAETAARILGDDVDIEIIEAHHRNKVDAPSGTALGLGESVAKALGRNLGDVSIYGRQGITGVRDRRTIGFHSVRGGDIVGEHTVVFAGAGERLEITHRSQSRTNFAEGALRAAAWVASQSEGVFDMQDVLGLA
jgi:4-hydroxy-tetrahydrodipicolinate reductase